MKEKEKALEWGGGGLGVLGAGTVRAALLNSGDGFQEDLRKVRSLVKWLFGKWASQAV